MLSAPGLHTPCDAEHLTPSDQPPHPDTAPVLFTLLQNLPPVFIVCQRKTALCKIAMGEQEFLQLAADISFA